MLDRRRKVQAGARGVYPAHPGFRIHDIGDSFLLDSFFMGGFDASTQRRSDGRRLDLVEATGHAALVRSDFAQLQDFGIRTVRDGIRWHLIETAPGTYDWSSALPILEAAQALGTQVIWDLAHYGWPDDLDIWSEAFVERFAAFAAAFAGLVRDRGVQAPCYCPVNEISFWAWAGGEVAYFNPHCKRRGGELKRQLARAAIAATWAIRRVDPSARFISTDPAIHVIPHPRHPEQAAAAAAYGLAQYEALDMVLGTRAPELGGSPDLIDILGVNYYPHNQWILNGRTIFRHSRYYRPFREILAEIHARYGKPMLIAETGTEGDARAGWFRYVCREVRHAMAAGAPIVGICLYPVTDYPGWVDERHCQTGLLGRPELGRPELGRPDGMSRPVDQPLARELALQQVLFQRPRRSVRG